MKNGTIQPRMPMSSKVWAPYATMRRRAVRFLSTGPSRAAGSLAGPAVRAMPWGSTNQPIAPAASGPSAVTAKAQRQPQRPLAQPVSKSDTEVPMVNAPI